MYPIDGKFHIYPEGERALALDVVADFELLFSATSKNYVEFLFCISSINYVEISIHILPF